MLKEQIKKIKHYSKKLREFIKVNGIESNNYKEGRLTKNGYICLELDKGFGGLKSLLSKAGFFAFHVTNNAKLVYAHQVVLFAHIGFKALINGFRAEKGKVEGHHLSHNKVDNRINNLIYLSPQDNLMCSEALSQPYGGWVDNAEPTPFNNQGKEIKNPKAYLAKIMLQTAKATRTYLEPQLTPQAEIPKSKRLAVAASLLMELPANLYKQVVRFFFSPTCCSLLWDLESPVGKLIRALKREEVLCL